MKVWLITIGETLPVEPGVRKMRTAMLAERLVARGHSVRWWVSAFEHQRKVMMYESDQEIPLSSGLTLQVLRGCGYSSNISLARYLDHRLVAGKFRSQAQKFAPPDVIVASMPCHHLAFEAVRYARLKNIPVLVDVRDLWPDIFINGIRNRLFKKLGRLALNSDFRRLRQLLTKADGLVAVSGGYLDWALKKAGRPAQEWDRVFFLGYQAGSRPPDLPPWLRGHETKKLILFIGTFGFSYELSLVVDAARRLGSSSREDVCFILAGTGEQAEMVHRKSVGLSNVILPGWLDAPEISALLGHGYLGLVPVNMAKDTISNKPFEYLSAGLPIVSSLEGETANLINGYGMGLSYRSGDLSGLCVAIEALLDDHNTRNEMSTNALAFFKEHGDADKIYAQYATHIENLVSASSQRSLHHILVDP